MTDDGHVELRLLGRFAVLRDGVEVPTTAYGGRKVRGLLKVLATRQGQFVSNDVLAEALWPDRLPSDPVANLQVLVNRARRALGDGSLITTGAGGYSLAAPPRVVVDSEQFLAAGAPREALGLWHGDPLPEEAYDAWASDYRELLLRTHQRALEDAASALLSDGDPAGAAELAHQAVEAEPLRERSALLLVRALAESGDGAAALMAYDDHRRLLADELGVDPSPEAAALHQQLLSSTAAAPARRRGRDLGELAFVGRDAELTALREALDRGLVALSGGSGSGKSTLLDRLGVAVRARAFLPERSEPWSLLRTLLREVVALDVTRADALPPPLASALGWLLPELAAPTSDVDPETRRVLLQEAALHLLAGAGDVAVDDVQWCDPSSLGVLEAAAGRGVRMVLAVRPDEVDGPVAALVARVPVTVDLPPLTDAAIHDLVDDPVATALAHETDRTPMAVVETLRALAAEGCVVPGPGGRWRSVDERAGTRAADLAREGQQRAIGLRVAARPIDEREVLAVLALLGREARPAVLDVAVGDEVLEALSRLHRRGLVRVGEQGWATAHDMVTDVVVDGLDPAERSRLHAALARALADEDDPALLAHHLRKAGDLEGARAAYLRAAERALAAVADAEALRLAEAGLAIGPSPALHEVRGEARQRLGDLTGAREDLRTALGGTTDSQVRSRLLARLAMLALGADDPVRGGQLAELALAEAGPDPAVRARALEVASVLDMNLDHADRASTRATEALALYEQAGDAGGMARVLDAQAMALFLDGDVRGGGASLRRAAELFEDAGDLVRVVTPRSTGGHAAVFEGRPEDGLAQTTAALDLARMLGHPEGQTYALWHRTEALAALGRGDEAAAAADEALEIATRIQHRGWTATAWRARGLAAQACGDLEAALAAYRRQLELSEHLGLFACWALARISLVLVRLDRAEEARPLVARAVIEGPPLGHHEARWAQAEVAHALGDPIAGELAVAALGRMETAGVAQGHVELLRIASTLDA